MRRLAGWPRRHVRRSRLDGPRCDFPVQQDEAHCWVVSLRVMVQEVEAEHCALPFLGGEHSAAAHSDAELVRCFRVCWGAAVEHCARANQESEPADARCYCYSGGEQVQSFRVCWGAAVEHCARAYQESKLADARCYCYSGGEQVQSFRVCWGAAVEHCAHANQESEPADARCYCYSGGEQICCFLVCWHAAVEHCAHANQESEPADARCYSGGKRSPKHAPVGCRPAADEAQPWVDWRCSRVN